MRWYKLAAKHLGIFGVHCMVHCTESCSSVLDVFGLPALVFLQRQIIKLVAAAHITPCSA